MGRRKVDKELDEISRYLLQKGAYSLKASSNAADKMILKAIKKNEAKIYRFWLGVFYAFILMISLSWLPLFGPMIAGYVGGKRTGSPAKGTLMAVIVIAVFYLLSSPQAVANMPMNITSARDSLVASTVAQFPWMQPLASFLVSYTTPTVTLLSGKISYTPQSYSILLVFAYIGGTLAMQRREEIRLLALSRITSSLVVQPITQPMPHHSAVPLYRSSGPSFSDYGSRDPEFREIYREEFHESPRKKPSKRVKSSKERSSSAPAHRSMKKEELIKHASHRKTSSHRYGFL